MARHFFFYGTLRPDLAQGLPARLIERLEPVGGAVAHGRMLARRDPRGVYPVLVRGTGRVHGMVCRADGRLSGPWLDALDRYEGAAGGGGEYLRRPIAVRLAGARRITAQAYLFNRPLLPALIPVPHGDFARFLAETGLRPFAG